MTWEMVKNLGHVKPKNSHFRYGFELITKSYEEAWLVSEVPEAGLERRLSSMSLVDCDVL